MLNNWLLLSRMPATSACLRLHGRVSPLYGEAFDANCVVLEARDLFRDFEGACELKTALSQKLMTLAAERDRTHCASRVGLESLPLN